MRVHCPKCGTLYNIPDDKLSDNGLPTKCAKCDTIFRVFPPIQDKIEPDEPEPPKESEDFPVPEPKPKKQVEKTFLFDNKPGKQDLYGIDDDLLGKEFKFYNQPGFKIGLAIFGMILLIGMLYYITSVSKEVYDTVEATEDRDVYSEAKTIKKEQPSPQKLLDNGVAIWRKSGLENMSFSGNLFQLVLASEPGNLEAKARLAEMDILAGVKTDSMKTSADGACTISKTLSEAIKDDPNVLRAQATCLWYQHKFNDAVSLAQQSIKAKELDAALDAEAFLLIGKVRLDQKKKKEAGIAFQEALKINSGLFEAHHYFASLLAMDKKFVPAVDQEKLALKINPTSTIAKQKLDEYLSKVSKLKNLDQGAGTYAEHMEAAKNYRKKGKTGDAIKQLTKALKLKPGSSQALMMKAWLMVDSNPQAALTHFSKAARNGAIDGYYGMGAMQQALGQNSAAITSYEAYIRYSPRGRYSEETRSILRNLKGQ